MYTGRLKLDELCRAEILSNVGQAFRLSPPGFPPGAPRAERTLANPLQNQSLAKPYLAPGTSIDKSATNGKWSEAIKDRRLL